MTVLDWPGDIFDAMTWAINGELPPDPDVDPLAELKATATMIGYAPRFDRESQGSQGAP